jgi:hypothetical protein
MRITKYHLICHVLATRGPMCRVDLMRRVHVLEGKETAFVPGNLRWYFLKENAPRFNRGSVFTKGLVQVVSKRRRTHLLDVTNAGIAKAREFQVWAEMETV